MARMKSPDPRRHAQLAQNVVPINKDDIAHSEEDVKVIEFSDDSLHNAKDVKVIELSNDSQTINPKHIHDCDLI
jgi:hypothetical protein